MLINSENNYQQVKDKFNDQSWVIDTNYKRLFKVDYSKNMIPWVCYLPDFNISNINIASNNDIKEYHERTDKDMEFIHKFIALLNEYDKSIMVDVSAHGDSSLYIGPLNFDFKYHIYLNHEDILNKIRYEWV